MQNSDANELMDGVKTDDGDGDGAEKTTDKDDLNDTKVDKNDKAEKEKKRQAFRGKLTILLHFPFSNSIPIK